MIKLIFFIIAIAVIMFGVVAGVGALLHYIEGNHRGIVKMIADEDDDDDEIAVG